MRTKKGGEKSLKILDVELRLRGFSRKTIENYVRQCRLFLEFAKKEPEKILERDIKNYFVYLMTEKGVKNTTINLKLSALKFFFLEVLERDIFKKIKHPKMEKKIPDALSRKEVEIILANTKNFKHRLLFEFMYGSGLRVSECVNFKIKDIDFDEKIAKVRGGKGNKERMIILSNSFCGKVKKYIEERVVDSEYLFPSPSFPNKQLSVRAVQKALKIVAMKAKIKKDVYCHILRSSFATHLLEDSVDIRYIQELLGHSNLSTTQRYTKVNLSKLKKIKSPLD